MQLLEREERETFFMAGLGVCGAIVVRIDTQVLVFIDCARVRRVALRGQALREEIEQE